MGRIARCDSILASCSTNCFVSPWSTFTHLAQVADWVLLLVLLLLLLCVVWCAGAGAGAQDHLVGDADGQPPRPAACSDPWYHW
jgi:hypothetical protein